MAFFTRQDRGRVYVIRVTLPGGLVVYKIGMTNSPRSVDRMMEILRSWFMQYRFVPHTELKLDLECSHPRELEQHIHKVLSRQQFIPSKKVDGGTEMFIEIDEFRVIHYLKQFNMRNFDKPLKLTSKDYDALGQLLNGR